MLKKIKIICLATLLLVVWQLQGRGQHLDVPVVYQERSQWCWAAVSQSVLGYYGKEFEQCDIAEYTRSVATWHSFGSVHCCTGGCDHWNYIQGLAGSIEDILLQLGNLQTHWYYGSLSRQEIAFEMEGGRPFIIRWGWTGGGGHFLVVHGLSGNGVYYMDPLYGSMVGSFTHMLGSAHHTWTSTLRMDMFTSVNDGRGPGDEMPGLQPFRDGFLVYPNPATGLVRLELAGAHNASQSVFDNEPVQLSLVNPHGKVVREYRLPGGLAEGFVLDAGDLLPGLYFLVVDGRHARLQQKLLVTGN